MTIADYAAASRWVAEHLDDETLPLRLHDRAIGEDGAPRLSARFLAWLTAGPFDIESRIETRTCTHPRLADVAWRQKNLPEPDVWSCPSCAGSCVYDTTVSRYRRPMRAALERLRLHPGRWPERQMTPYMVLRWWMTRGLDGPEAAWDSGTGWDTFEALVVMAVRKLAGRYQQSPYRTIGWVDKSEAQQHAEDDAA